MTWVERLRAYGAGNHEIEYDDPDMILDELSKALEQDPLLGGRIVSDVGGGIEMAKILIDEVLFSEDLPPTKSQARRNGRISRLVAFFAENFPLFAENIAPPNDAAESVDVRIELVAYLEKGVVDEQGENAVGNADDIEFARQQAARVIATLSDQSTAFAFGIEDDSGKIVRQSLVEMLKSKQSLTKQYAAQALGNLSLQCPSFARSLDATLGSEIRQRLLEMFSSKQPSMVRISAVYCAGSLAEHCSLFASAIDSNENGIGAALRQCMINSLEEKQQQDENDEGNLHHQHHHHHNQLSRTGSFSTAPQNLQGNAAGAIASVVHHTSAAFPHAMEFEHGPRLRFLLRQVLRSPNAAAWAKANAARAMAYMVRQCPEFADALNAEEEQFAIAAGLGGGGEGDSPKSEKEGEEAEDQDRHHHEHDDGDEKSNNNNNESSTKGICQDLVDFLVKNTSRGEVDDMGEERESISKLSTSRLIRAIAIFVEHCSNCACCVNHDTECLESLANILAESLKREQSGGGEGEEGDEEGGGGGGGPSQGLARTCSSASATTSNGQGENPRGEGLRESAAFAISILSEKCPAFIHIFSEPHGESAGELLGELLAADNVSDAIRVHAARAISKLAEESASGFIEGLNCDEKGVRIRSNLASILMYSTRHGSDDVTRSHVARTVGILATHSPTFADKFDAEHGSGLPLALNALLSSSNSSVKTNAAFAISAVSEVCPSFAEEMVTNYEENCQEQLIAMISNASSDDKVREEMQVSASCALATLSWRSARFAESISRVHGKAIRLRLPVLLDASAGERTNGEMARAVANIADRCESFSLSLDEECGHIVRNRLVEMLSLNNDMSSSAAQALAVLCCSSEFFKNALSRGELEKAIARRLAMLLNGSERSKFHAARAIGMLSEISADFAKIMDLDHGRPVRSRLGMLVGDRKSGMEMKINAALALGVLSQQRESFAKMLDKEVGKPVREGLLQMLQSNNIEAQLMAAKCVSSICDNCPPFRKAIKIQCGSKIADALKKIISSSSQAAEEDIDSNNDSINDLGAVAKYAQQAVERVDSAAALDEIIPVRYGTRTPKSSAEMEDEDSAERQRRKDAEAALFKQDDREERRRLKQERSDALRRERELARQRPEMADIPAADGDDGGAAAAAAAAAGVRGGGDRRAAAPGFGGFGGGATFMNSDAMRSALGEQFGRLNEMIRATGGIQTNRPAIAYHAANDFDDAAAEDDEGDDTNEDLETLLGSLSAESQAEIISLLTSGAMTQEELIANLTVATLGQ